MRTKKTVGDKVLVILQTVQVRDRWENTNTSLAMLGRFSKF